MKKLQELFKKSQPKKPSPKLLGLILTRLEQEKKKRMRRKLFLSIAGLIISVMAGIGALAFFGQAFLHSEFWSMASLVFSDILVVGAHWKEYSFSLLETFPTTDAIAILIPLFTLLLSAYFYSSIKRKYTDDKFNFLNRQMLAH